MEFTKQNIVEGYEALQKEFVKVVAEATFKKIAAKLEEPMSKFHLTKYGQVTLGVKFPYEVTNESIELEKQLGGEWATVDLYVKALSLVEEKFKGKGFKEIIFLNGEFVLR